MRIKMNRQIEINAPAEKVWRILAHEFEYIDRWSSGITKSKASTDGSIPEGAKVCGRVCDTVLEEFTHYDEEAKRFGYRMIDPPWFIRSIGNNWSVRPLEPNKSVVEMRPEIDLNPILALLLIPLIKIGGGIVADRTFQELKYYVEHDKPHPRKLKAQQKQLQKASAEA